MGAVGAMFFGRKKRHIVRLLVVEDEPLVAFDNEYALSDAGFKVVATVARADAAMAALKDGVDLVVSDVHLAEGSGLDVARAAQAAGIPVLFVSGACRAVAHGLTAGCLAKPYAPRDLVAAIHAIDATLAGDKVRRMPNGFTLFASDEREDAG